MDRKEGPGQKEGLWRYGAKKGNAGSAKKERERLFDNVAADLNKEKISLET